MHKDLVRKRVHISEKSGSHCSDKRVFWINYSGRQWMPQQTESSTIEAAIVSTPNYVGDKAAHVKAHMTENCLYVYWLTFRQVSKPDSRIG
jgi:hypothetical protein